MRALARQPRQSLQRQALTAHVLPREPTENFMGETTIPATSRRGVPIWVQIFIWGALIGLLVFLAIILKRSQQGTVQPGDQIRDFSMTLFSGYEFAGQSQVRLMDLRGKVVMINFWASWCKPCEQEAADLRAAWAHYQPRGDVAFLGADYVDTEPEARAYLKKFDITYPNGPDLGTKLSQQFRIKGVPETYFIDQNGLLRYVQIGPFTSLDQIQSIIDPLLH
jgi:cytochrome c biogenesis protein CcmG, thiol:disulfide interchange protein DsbE